VLLYGIGNDLRGDDGAGPRRGPRARGARAVGRAARCTGSTPELADDLVEADLALFVDAPPTRRWTEPSWTPRPPARRRAGQLLGHTLDVPGLLAW
jgi:hypothetical protein